MKKAYSALWQNFRKHYGLGDYYDHEFNGDWPDTTEREYRQDVNCILAKFRLSEEQDNLLWAWFTDHVCLEGVY